MKYWKTIIELCKDNIQQLKDAGQKANVKYSSIDSAICSIDGYYEYKQCTVNYYKSCGMWMQLEFEARRCFWDRVKGFFMACIGILTMIAGAVCCCFGAVNIGKSLISTGWSAVVEGVTSMITGQARDFGDWLQDYTMQLAVGVMQAAIWDLAGPILNSISCVAKTVVDVGKKTYDVVKSLVDRNIFNKIGDGDLDLFDIADSGSTVIGGDAGKVIQTTSSAIQTGTALANAIESGDMNDFCDAAKHVSSISSLVGKKAIKQKLNDLVKEFVDRYLVKMKDLVDYDDGVKDWKSNNAKLTTDVVYVLMQSEDKDKIDAGFVDTINEKLCNVILGELRKEVEPTLVKLFQPDNGLVDTMSADNVASILDGMI